jgi:hypothetical protein
MGGRGSASTPAAGRSDAAQVKAAGSGSVGSVKKKASEASPAEKAYKGSIKAKTKGMTKASLGKMPRSRLESIAVAQMTKVYKDQYGKYTKGGLSADAAYTMAKAMVGQQTTAQLRKTVWKYRNLD